MRSAVVRESSGIRTHMAGPRTYVWLRVDITPQGTWAGAWLARKAGDLCRSRLVEIERAGSRRRWEAAATRRDLNQTRLPAELKHINKRRKRHQQGFPQ
jgi:hypothetical protein